MPRDVATVSRERPRPATEAEAATPLAAVPAPAVAALGPAAVLAAQAGGGNALVAREIARLRRPGRRRAAGDHADGDRHDEGHCGPLCDCEDCGHRHGGGAVARTPAHECGPGCGCPECAARLRMATPGIARSHRMIARGLLDDVSSAIDSVTETISDAADAVAETAGEVIDAAGEAIDSAGEAISDAAGAVKEGAMDVLDMRECEEELDELEDKEDFLSSSYGPEDLRAPTGIGGFGAEYSPTAGELTITLRGAVNFVDGLTIDAGGTVTAASGAHANAGAAATQIMSLPPDQRPAAVAAWQWGSTKSTWLTGFASAVEGAWGGQFEFRMTRRYWEDIGATVNVYVDVREGEKAGDDHMAMTVFKVPDNFVGGVGVVNSGGAGLLDNGATNNRMTLNSNDIMARRDNLLVPDPVDFDTGSTTLTAAASGQMTTIAATYAAGLTPTCSSCGKNIEGTSGPVLTITCQGDGTDPAASARSRFDAIKAGLVAAGFSNADSRTTYAQAATDGQRCTLHADSGVAQVVAAHEAGHMFGLGDEYAVDPAGSIRGTGRRAGEATKHDQLVKDMGLDGSVAENNDNMMSVGNVVRPQHYATFFWALKEITGEDDWGLGAAGVASLPTCAMGPGDFPTPSPDGPMVA